MAGAYIGIINDQLIVAGGSWFPNGRTGEKTYTDRILSYDFASKTWQQVGTLPARRAHGAAVVRGQELICIGGQDKDNAMATVWRIRISDKAASVDSLPDLPHAMSFLAATIARDTVYAAANKGSDSGTHHFYTLTAGSDKWQTLAPLPGPKRFGAKLITQNDGEFTALYLIGGKGGESGTTYLKDGFKYNIKKAAWKAITDY